MKATGKLQPLFFSAKCSVWENLRRLLALRKRKMFDSFGHRFFSKLKLRSPKLLIYLYMWEINVRIGTRRTFWKCIHLICVFFLYCFRHSDTGFRSSRLLWPLIPFNICWPSAPKVVRFGCILLYCVVFTTESWIFVYVWSVYLCVHVVSVWHMGQKLIRRDLKSGYCTIVAVSNGRSGH